MNNHNEVFLTGDLDTVEGYRAEAEQRIIDAIEEIAAPDIEDIDPETRKRTHAKITLKLAQALACIRGARNSLIEAEKGKGK